MQPMRVEIGHRSPCQNLGGAVERHVQQVFDFLSGPELLPAAREFRDARLAGEGNDAAVLGADAELALSLDRGARHRPSMWQAVSAEAGWSRARVRKGVGPDRLRSLG